MNVNHVADFLSCDMIHILQINQDFLLDRNVF